MRACKLVILQAAREELPNLDLRFFVYLHHWILHARVGLAKEGCHECAGKVRRT